ncbi:MAG: O-methyltransferase, partial [Sphingobacterium sp.]
MFEKSEQLNGYLEDTTDVENPLLKRIHRETYLKETMPHMLSGHYQGRVLAMLSQLVSPGLALEIGTFTGYATLCLAEGLQSDGILHTIDINQEQEDRVQGYFDESPYG